MPSQRKLRCTPELSTSVCRHSALTGRVIAQSVTVDATIDSLQILIGEQAKIKLQVSLDTDKRAILPAYTDTLVRGVEIVDIAKPDTQMLSTALSEINIFSFSD